MEELIKRLRDGTTVPLMEERHAVADALEAQQARIVELREALEWAEAEVGWRFEDVLGWPDDTNDLAAHDAAIRKATLLEFAYKWLPHLRQESPQSSLAQTEFNLAIDAAVKHALRMAEGE